MQSRVLQRLALAAVLVLGAGVSVVSTAVARPSRPITRAARGGFNLFQGSIGLRLHANRVDCNWLTNFGNQCTNPYGSGTIEAGFWPNGSPDSYIFNSGLQIAGTVCYNPPSCTQAGVWAGDTVGTFFMDARGDQRQGDAVTNIFDGLNADDIAAWPTAANVNDPTLYNKALLGRKTISQQDTWVRYWDGNPSLSTGRKHAMGVLVEQRGLLWNYPSGNEDILYFLFRFINITSLNRTDYQALEDSAGYSSADVDRIVAIAQDFHNRAQAAYGVTVPASGFTFHNMFAAFYQDADEGNASYNYSQAVLPFSLVSVMKADYREPLWQYPANIFGDPFYPAPGYEAAKYLKSPIDPSTGREFGISMWSNTCNGCGLMNDPVGVSQMYRFLSGHVTPSLGDGVCNSNPIVLHTCASLQAYADTRYFESSGPFDMAPGQSSVIVVALVFAAPLHNWAATSNGIYAMPAGSIQNYINANLVDTYLPGYPPQPDTLALAGTGGGTRVCLAACTAAATIRDPVERPMGWGQFSDLNGDGIIEQDEVQTAPRSLLAKALTAQAIFDNKFLLPFAPESPTFYLVPGDGQVTVAWQKSNTENATCSTPPCGDPYYGIASAPVITDSTTVPPTVKANPLYDPDYRQFDVEGYRIWRGRTASEMKVIAQFDYVGTTVTDYVGQFYDPNTFGNQCAPELKIIASCPTAFDTTGNPLSGTPNLYPLVGNVIQITPGGRVQLQGGDTTIAGVHYKLANGNILIVAADTAIVGGATHLPALVDNGVPFAFVDRGLLDGVQYFYAVTAFDVNSVKSGPSSLESSLVAQSVTPRAEGSNANVAVIVTGEFGDDNVALDPNAAAPKMDASSGAVTGVIPPTNAASFGFLASVAEALPPGDITALIDSLVPGTVGGFGGPYASMYVSFISGKDTVRAALPFDPGDGYNAVNATLTSNWVLDSASAPLVHYDSARAATLGLSGLFKAGATMPVQFKTFIAPMGAVTPGNLTMSSQRYPWTGETAAQRHSALLSQPVWYDQGSAEPPQPTVNPFASAANTDGKLTGVSMIYQALTYRLPNTGTPPGINILHRYVQYGTSLGHPGDFVVTWNADSTITVRDSTHHVNVPFATDMRVSWGFVNERALTAAGVANGDIADGTGTPTVGVVGYWHQYAIAPVCSLTYGITCAPLENKAEYEPINYDNTGTANGNGISLYIDGSFFIMQMASLPAAGTKWHLKVLDGMVDATCSNYTPATPAAAATACSGYSYTPLPYRQPYVPGLSLKLRVTQAFGINKAAGNMSAIHTVPDPYYVTNALETSANNKVLRFVNLPNQAIVRIYSVSGILVRVLTHNDPTGGGEATWDLRNRNNQFVASGVYFYHVEAPDGSTKIGRFTVVNFAQ